MHCEELSTRSGNQWALCSLVGDLAVWFRLLMAKVVMVSCQDLPSSLVVLWGFLLCSFCSSYYHKHPSFLILCTASGPILPGCFTCSSILSFLQGAEIKYGFSQGTFPKIVLSGDAQHFKLNKHINPSSKFSYVLCVQTLEHVETPHLIQLVQFYIQMRLQTQVKHQQGHDGFPLPFSHLFWTPQTLEQSQQD